MIKSILSLAFVITLSSQSERKSFSPVDDFDIETAKSETLGVRTLNHTLLNKTIFFLVNKKRKKKGLEPLKYTSSLNQVAIKYQDDLEFKRFKNVGSVERKISKTVFKRTKKAGFDGGLVVPIVAECEVMDYDGKADFFVNKNAKDSEFKLFYGKKPKKTEINPVREAVKPLSYYSLAKKLIKSLESENKKELYSKAYKWSGLHLQWYYKSLNKRRMPKIKMIILIGGYATAGMR